MPKELPSISSHQKNLLSWYAKHHRNLPWRKTRDPYAIWISEIMLQQTRVSTVIPYYETFLKTFPNPKTLAKAKEQKVLKLWEGLGYYSRARNLQTTAKEIVQTYNGELPKTSKELQNLKGFGPYTAAAVSSIAFGEPVAVVDGNVRRVISRWFATHTSIEGFAQKVLAKENPSHWNQAVMELGALVCLPKNPKCQTCPVRENCLAFQKKQIWKFPAKKKKPNVKKIFSTIVVPRWGSKLLICQRVSEGRWERFWEFPTFETSHKISLSEIKEKVRAQWNLKTKTLKSIKAYSHSLSHQTHNVSVYLATCENPPQVSKGKWIDPKKLSQFPLSRLQQKAFEPTSF